MLAAADSVLPTIGAVVGILVGLVALLGASGLIVRGSILKATNETLDDALRVEREARAQDNAKCAGEIAELRGQVSILTAAFARSAGKEVAGVVVAELRDAGVIK